MNVNLTAKASKTTLKYVGFSHLNHLFKNSLSYHHLKENYKANLQEEVIPTGLKL